MKIRQERNELQELLESVFREFYKVWVRQTDKLYNQLMCKEVLKQQH